MDRNQVADRSKTTGGLLKFSVSMSEGQVAEIDRIASEKETSRSAVLRDLVGIGLKFHRSAAELMSDSLKAIAS